MKLKCQIYNNLFPKIYQLMQLNRTYFIDYLKSRTAQAFIDMKKMFLIKYFSEYIDT